jgi:hypothetical protein
MQMRSEDLSTLRGSNVGDEGRDVRKGFDGVEIDTDDEGAFWHILLSDLEPTARGSTEIDTAFRPSQEIVFSVQMNELAEGISGVQNFTRGPEGTYKAERALYPCSFASL